MRYFVLFIFAILFASCSEKEIDNSKVGIPPQVVVSKSYKKHLVIDKDMLRKARNNDRSTSVILKRNYIIAYGRALKSVSQDKDGYVIFTATKEDLNISEELYNIVRYVFLDYNATLKSIKSKRDIVVRIRPINKQLKIDNTDLVRVEDIQRLYEKANK